MTTVMQAVSAALIDFVWQGMAVALLLWIALMLFRRRSANVRYVASCAALAALAVAPLVTGVIHYNRLKPVVTASASTVVSPVVTTMLSVSGEGASRFQAVLRAMQPWALPLWAAGVLAFSLRLVWSWRQVSRLRRAGDAARDEVLALVEKLAVRLRCGRRVRVLISSIAEGPGVVGWLRPVVLLPASTLLGLSPEQLEAVLAHELAHIRRHDYLVNLVQLTIETLLFYHPAVWWISSRIRHERELCCDDLAVGLTGDAIGYARALTRLERLRVSEPVMAMSGRGGSLVYRVRRLVGAETRELGPSRLPGIVTLVLGGVCLAFNLYPARAQGQEGVLGQVMGSITWRTSTDAAGVKVNLEPTAVLHRSGVEYPEAALAKGIQGSVLVQVDVDARGEVSDARVVSGPAELRRPVLESVLQWHFTRASAGTVRQVGIDFRPPTAEERKKNTGVAFLTRDEPVGNILLKADSALVDANPGLTVDGQLIDAQVAELKARLAALTGNGSRDMEQQVRDLQEEVGNLARLGETVQVNFNLSPAVEGTLKQINFERIPEALRSEVLAQLPFKIGDKVTQETIEAATKALHNFDEHFSMNVERMGKGKVIIVIVAPGARE
jgi:TonB family protein